MDRRDLIIRIVQTAQPSPDRAKRIQCRANGCGNMTYELKPYCSDHIGHGHYPGQILSDIERQRKEAEALAAGKWPGDDSYLVQEVLAILSFGVRIRVAEIARTMQLTMPQIDTLINGMAKRKLVRTKRSSRGVVTVST